MPLTQRELTIVRSVEPPAAKAEEGQDAASPDLSVMDSAPITEPQQPLSLAAEPTSPAAPPAAEIPTEVKPEEVVIRLGDRKYRVRGLAKNLSYEQLRVNVLASRTGSGELATDTGYHVDTFDLYAARQRALFIKQAAEELAVKEDVIKKDLGKVLLKLEELQDEQIRRRSSPRSKTVVLTEAEQAAALDLLKDPKLLDRILADFERCGVVGEETNKLVGYLAAVSRKLDEPLAVMIQSSSAAGKTALMEAILAFMPEEERVKYSAMTGQSLFYLGETDLQHKILALVEEEGAQRASYALKLLQSEGELTIASTGKDPTTGQLVTHEYRVEGPVMIVLTTTAVEIDDELSTAAWCSRSTRTANRPAPSTAASASARPSKACSPSTSARGSLEVHRNAQRLLRPLLVVNPFARQLTFLDDAHAHAARSHEVPDPHPHDRAAAPVPAAGEDRRRTTGRSSAVHRGDARPTSRSPTASRMRCSAARSTSCRRRPAACSCSRWMVTRRCTRLAIDRSDYRFSRRDVRAMTRLGRLPAEDAPAQARRAGIRARAPRRAGARASSTSCSSMAGEGTAGRVCRASSTSSALPTTTTEEGAPRRGDRDAEKDPKSWGCPRGSPRLTETPRQ